ncbi:MAG TPA: hypothetical protein PK336_07285 [Methanoculleus sp.]|nr:hypothetical protein [Methanoculleus sp.]
MSIDGTCPLITFAWKSRLNALPRRCGGSLCDPSAIVPHNYIYITKDEYMMYMWDNDNVIYQPLGLSSIEIDAMIGGNATTDFEKE